MKGLIQSEQGRKIYVIRHGQTVMNDKGLIHGWSQDPLDEDGMEHAHELAENLKDTGIDGLCVSDLLRAQQTGLIVSAGTGVPILRSSSGFRPWDIGKLMHTDREKANEILDEYALKTPDKLIEEGESFNNFKTRFLVSVITALNRYEGTIAFVTHSLNDRLIRAWIANGCPPDLDLDMDIYMEESEDPATAQELYVDCMLVNQ